MSLSSKESLDAIANWAEWLSAIFGILAAISVIVLVFVNKPLKRIAEHEAQAERDKTAAFQSVAAQANERSLKLEAGNLALKTDLEKAKAEAAQAELSLKRYIDHVDRKAGPRRIDREPFLKELKDRPTGTATISYKPEDMEAFNFASNMSSLLKIAGWNVLGPMPFKELRNAMPSEFWHGGAFGSGVTVWCNRCPSHADDDNTPAGALIAALDWALQGGSGYECNHAPGAKPDEFHIVIGQKR